MLQPVSWYVWQIFAMSEMSSSIGTEGHQGDLIVYKPKKNQFTFFDQKPIEMIYNTYVIYNPKNHTRAPVIISAECERKEMLSFLDCRKPNNVLDIGISYLNYYSKLPSPDDQIIQLLLLEYHVW